MSLATNLFLIVLGINIMCALVIPDTTPGEFKSSPMIGAIKTAFIGQNATQQEMGSVSPTSPNAQYYQTRKGEQSHLWGRQHNL